MFITALFVIAKIWKQPKCLSMDKWVKKMWYIHSTTTIILQLSRCRILLSYKKDEILPTGWTLNVLC